jgi:uncharacterized protein
MSAMIFVNLPVKDLDRSVRFFTALGFSFDPQFTDENATCMVISDSAFVMLLLEPFFSRFTTKEIADTARSTEAILSLSADSAAHVDEQYEKAIAAGGSPAGATVQEQGMYSRGFYDPDGHLWEFGFMDSSAMAGGTEPGSSTVSATAQA